ncbi:MAG: RluA family pseudouridine synthase, partial [Clostridia bacterium]|nr:RluA family pseudouridine synthase [Clostridia bacterium]
GDVVEITMPELKPYEAIPQKMDLDIRYEDKDVLVINKPKGMVVHPAPGNEDGTLVNALLDYCKEDLSGIGGVQRPGIVHRIDKETSGLLIVAKNDMAHRHLSDQLKTRTLSRKYYALVLGNIKEDSGTIDAPIGRSLKDRKKMAIIANGRDAVTHFRVLARYVGYTLVECKLQTGRTHQIRVHMAHIHHPIAGDNVYGNKTDKSGIDGQCLHAKELEFIHPATEENIHVECPLPEYFETFLKKLKPLE